MKTRYLAVALLTCAGCTDDPMYTPTGTGPGATLKFRKVT